MHSTSITVLFLAAFTIASSLAHVNCGSNSTSSSIPQSSAAQNSSNSESITISHSSSASSSQSASTKLPPSSSTTISSSKNPSQAPPSSTASAKPSASKCLTSGTCNNYKLLKCPDGVCACGQDINNIPTCLQDKSCADLSKCNKDADCGASEACTANTCCGHGGYCVPTAVGCLTSPAWVAHAAPVCKKIKARGISALAGGGIRTDRLVC